MTPDEFRRAMEAEPFRPFVIPLAGGDSVAVWERDQVEYPLSIRPTGEGEAHVVVVVRHEGDNISFVDLTLGIRRQCSLRELPGRPE
jgi:hypothetical protein